jgi:hypothetical protein
VPHFSSLKPVTGLAHVVEKLAEEVPPDVAYFIFRDGRQVGQAPALFLRDEIALEDWEGVLGAVFAFRGVEFCGVGLAVASVVQRGGVSG